MVLVKAVGGMTNPQLAEIARLASSFADASQYAVEKYVDRWVKRELENGTIVKEGRKNHSGFGKTPTFKNGSQGDKRRHMPLLLQHNRPDEDHHVAEGQQQNIPQNNEH